MIDEKAEMREEADKQAAAAVRCLALAIARAQRCVEAAEILGAKGWDVEKVPLMAALVGYGVKRGVLVLMDEMGKPERVYAVTGRATRGQIPMILTETACLLAMDAMGGEEEEEPEA